MRFVLLLLSCFTCVILQGQVHRQPDASKIKLNLKKLNSLGAVLYVAAHPDDENTRVIAYLVNDRLMATGYLSLTRGDGGQNLIGPEIRDLLGLIRTQELLAARRIDGGQQFFTRANDFGYSKSANETFQIWDKQAVLSDVIKVIRQFQPDVILTRFPPDERAGHGQHTASAILAAEGFAQSGSPEAFKDQVKDCGVWQVKRLYTNTGRWWNQTITENTPGVIAMNVGTYNPLLGESYSELAAESRTQHKSQGFGSSGRRGDALEYFEFIKGDSAKKDMFDGINTRWTRLKGGEKVEPLVEKAIRDFVMEKPVASVPALLEIRKQISLLEGSVWKTRKLREVNQLIVDCLGLFVEVTADHYWASPGEHVRTSFEVLNRSTGELALSRIVAPDLSIDTTLNALLKDNQPLTFKSSKLLRADKPYSGPYWLTEPHGQGLFTVTDKMLIGQPENDPALHVDFTFLANGQNLAIQVPVTYKETDPVKGELVRPFAVVPPVFLNLSDKVYLFPDQSPRDISVLVKSASEKKLTGTVQLSLPEHWKAEPAVIPFSLEKQGEELEVTFKVVPAGEEITAPVKVIASVEGKQYGQSLQLIAYDHIPVQTLTPKAESKLLRINVKKEGALIGYIKGAGDDVPSGLRHMGYQVWEMTDNEVTPENLRKVDAVVLGVRALNTNERIQHYMDDLLEYVRNGGTMITQYNTNHDLELDPEKIAPYSISLSRDRVTEENAAVRILKPDHPALNYPNQITARDFTGWVQERGLYFPDKWDSHFEALLSCNDSGEPPRDGSLLVARYGNGYYVYTGLSFFRELPEGVSGAYRLFANLVSLGKSKKPDHALVKPNGK